MYPVRIVLVGGNPHRPDDERCLGFLLPQLRSADGARAVRVRSQWRGPHLHAIAFVVAASPQAAVTHCRRSVEGMLSHTGPLTGWTLARCALGLGP